MISWRWGVIGLDFLPTETRAWYGRIWMDGGRAAERGQVEVWSIKRASQVEKST